MSISRLALVTDVQAQVCLLHSEHPTRSPPGLEACKVGGAEPVESPRALKSKDEQATVSLHFIGTGLFFFLLPFFFTETQLVAFENW